MDLELCADFLSRAQKIRQEEQDRLSKEIAMLSEDLHMIRVRAMGVVGLLRWPCFLLLIVLCCTLLSCPLLMHRSRSAETL